MSLTSSTDWWGTAEESPCLRAWEDLAEHKPPLLWGTHTRARLSASEGGRLPRSLAKRNANEKSRLAFPKHAELLHGSPRVANPLQ